MSAFQRNIDDFIKRHKLKKVYAYLDDITVTGATEEKHDSNLKKLLDAAEIDNFTLNKDKSRFKVTSLNLLEYNISHREIKPDPERLQALIDLPPPQTPKELTACLHTIHAGSHNYLERLVRYCKLLSFH